MSEKIEIIAFNPEWRNQFEMAKELLVAKLDDVIQSIEHIGSTSIEGLGAKNRIDIQLGVIEISQEICDLINERLEGLGFHRAFLSKDHLPPGEFEAKGWEKIYLQGFTDLWPFRANIHIRKIKAKNYRYALLFRDYLRANKEAAMAYERVKKNLSKYLPNDREAYCEIKDPVCDLIMLNANKWAIESNWE